MAKNNNIWIAVLVTAVLILGTFGLTTGFQFSTVGEGPTGAVTGAGQDWSDKPVPVEFELSDLYDSAATVNATVKVYASQPDDWEKPLADFDDAENYDTATLVDSDVDYLVFQDNPGTYYAVIQASGYNTKFETFEIPSYEDENQLLSDYADKPKLLKYKMTQVGTAAAAPSNIDFALTNDTDVNLRNVLNIEVAEDTEFLGWKINVEDKIKFSDDADGDDVSDEGIETFDFTFAGETYEVFEAGVTDNFDDYEYDANIDGVTAADQDFLNFEIDIVAEETGDYSGANDEVLGEGDGTVATVTIFNYGAEGNHNTFAQFDIVA